MQSGRTANTLVLIAVLSVPFLSSATRLNAEQAAEPAQVEDPARVTDLSASASWEDFVTLEVRETELVLTNVSDRPIPIFDSC